MAQGDGTSTAVHGRRITKRRCRVWSSRAGRRSRLACSCSRSSGSCTSCCRSSPGWARRWTISSTGTAGGSRSGLCSSCCSFAGYVVLFRAVFVAGRRGPVARPPAPGPIGWSESYQITMAGLAATRLFATAGAGGVALTAWALRRSGMEPRLVACRMVAFMVLLYAVYAGSVLIDGLGLGYGPVPGRRLVRAHDRPRRSSPRC